MVNSFYMVPHSNLPLAIWRIIPQMRNFYEHPYISGKAYDNKYTFMSVEPLNIHHIRQPKHIILCSHGYAIMLSDRA